MANDKALSFVISNKQFQDFSIIHKNQNIARGCIF